MKVRFDSLDRFEVPKFYVCSPGSQYQSGVLTKVLGGLSDTSDEELVLNFNAMSELNFRINKLRRSDPDEDAYVTMLYNALQNRRLIFVEDIGYFSISDVKNNYDNGIHYKDVQASSIEIEIQNKLVPYIEDGTYKFMDLMEKIVAVLPLWKIGTVNGDVAAKYRTFEGVSTELNALAFLQENMQDAYECIFFFDTIKREINVYDQNNYFEETSIHITKDDVIKSLDISEASEDLYTALNVQGDEYLNVSPVNPLGTNVMYNFDYYLDWMSDSLRKRVDAWQALVASKESEYYDLNLAYYENLTSQSNLNSEIDRINMQIEMYQRCRDNIVAEGSTATVESYNEVIEKNGGVPVGIQNELADTLAEIDSLTATARSNLASTKSELSNIAAEIETLREGILAIHDMVAITSYFNQEQYEELSNYIYEGSYTDEYIAVTSLMTYSERFQQMKTLYDRAKVKLQRISEPTYEFSLDVENFLFAKEFEKWSEQLEAGCLINVELDVNDVALLFLSNFTINYEDRSMQMTFGNRFSRFDPKAIFNGVLGDIKKSTNSINYIKDILYPVKDGEFNAMKEAIESSGILTKNAALASTNQEIIIDDTGILGRKLLDNGEYDGKQIKVTNQNIVFTDDGWETSRAAVGSFLFNNPLTGEVEEKYGVIADTLIGSLVLSEEVGIYNTNNSITLDKSGFTLTSDYTGDAPTQNVFTIQKKLLDENGNEYYSKQLYIDDDGNLVLNGSISIFTGGGSSGTGSGSTSLGDLAEDVKNLDEKIADAIEGMDGTYFYIRYSPNADGSGMTESPNDSTQYLGTANVTEKVAPTDPSAYHWSRIRGVDGTDGTPGVDGTSQYFHVKYSHDGKTFSGSNGEELGDYMGTCVTTAEADPTDFNAYTWQKITGEDGIDGVDGVDHFTWIKYADTPTSGMSDNPSGKKYMGLAYNKTVAAESTNYSDYTWSLIRGEDGTDGINGVDGSDGKTYYTWVKYADDAAGTNMTNDPDGKEYIGLAYNKETPSESNNPSDYTWALFKGSDGVDGKDGDTYYTWIKYADSPTSGMSESPDGKKYIGLAYNKATATESSNYGDYTWSLIKGEDGTDGINGVDGSDGKTYYTWIKYADDVYGTNMTNDPTGKEYIGLAYNKETPDESTNPDDYIWALFKGVDGVNGKDGSNFYTWIKYADTPTTGMSDSPDGKKYMGLAYNKTVATESANYSDYTWSLIRGEDGTDGINGVDGKDGKTYYTWVKYADDITGKNMTNDPTGKDYIGLAYNKTTSTESNVASDYTWALFKGADGVDGQDGKDGSNFYTWIKYADSPTSGMSDDPTGKKYIGMAYNKPSSSESVNYSDYIWSLMRGEDGKDGTNGINGVDGKTYYTWVKYAKDGSGTDMSDDPTGRDYIGLAYNKLTSTESTNPSDYSWSLFKGKDGVDGQDGADGVSSYFHVRYSANSNGSSMTTAPTSTTKYMGVCSSASPTAPTTYSSYTWYQCRGNDGQAGQNGTPGVNGVSSYFHVKYSDNGQSFTSNNGETLGDWIGTCVTTTQADPTSFSAYTWKKIRGEDGTNGIDGVDGTDGKSSYFFVKYSANANGNPMTEAPQSNTKYMGVCSTTTASAPTSYTSYTWTQCRGNDGQNGTPGTNGADGRTQYLHIKYSDDGTTFTANNGETLGAYIGTLVDFTEADSTTFSAYTWKKFTEDVDDELNELQNQITNNNNNLTDTIDKTTSNLRDEIESTKQEIGSDVDSKLEDMNNSINEQINSVSSTIDEKYATIIQNVNDQLTAHKADVGQYMTFNDNGLTLGATSSEFKTVIDNSGLYFKQGDIIVSYVDNNQLHIPNAVIESTLILGNFFFSPRADGSMSITWQE